MPGPVVREIEAKSILNPSKIHDYCVNPYTGCEVGCVYCYAALFMRRYSGHEEPWGEFVDVKVNAVEALARQLRRAEPGEVFVSSACDGWQPIEAECRLTRRCCELLVQRGFRVNVLSKSALVLRDLELFSPANATIGTTVTTLDERLRSLWEPGGSPVEQRFSILQQARQAGLKTSIMFGPLLPLLSDSQASLDALLERAAQLGVSRIWVDALNPRPRVWPAVAELLGREFPDLRERYRKLLFESQTRQTYLTQLRTRVARSAQRHHLAGRVSECF